MEVEGAASPPPKMWSLVRVTSPLLDSRKHWYVLTKNLCGTRPKDFSKNEISKKFPGEINCVSTREPHPATKSCSLNRKAVGLYVATSFGLCAALLRQRELPAEGFISSRQFLAVMNTVNGVALEFDPCSLGGKTYFGAQDQTPSPCFQTISVNFDLNLHWAPVLIIWLSVLFVVKVSQFYIKLYQFYRNFKIIYNNYNNFFFTFRQQLTQLVSNLNEQKRKIKNGIIVDGKKYQINFTGILAI